MTNNKGLLLADVLIAASLMALGLYAFIEATRTAQKTQIRAEAIRKEAQCTQEELINKALHIASPSPECHEK